MRLAERCGLPQLVAEQVRIIDRLGVNTPTKLCSIVAGMVAGADCIDDLDVLRHGGAMTASKAWSVNGRRSALARATSGLWLRAG